MGELETQALTDPEARFRRRALLSIVIAAVAMGTVASVVLALMYSKDKELVSSGPFGLPITVVDTAPLAKAIGTCPKAVARLGQGVRVEQVQDILHTSALTLPPQGATGCTHVAWAHGQSGSAELFFSLRAADPCLHLVFSTGQMRPLGGGRGMVGVDLVLDVRGCSEELR